MRFLTLSSLVLSAACALALPVQADPSPVVVELYTSQGCSSCPPADRILEQMANRADVLPLAYHVDYWDYIGWEDTFAEPEFTARQRGYAQVGGRNMIYTPQMIIMGQDDVVGANARQVTAMVEHHLGYETPVALSAAREGNDLAISLAARPQEASARLRVQLVRYMPLHRVDITRGELAGHTVNYANVVESQEVLADWDGVQALDLQVSLPDGLPAAVLVQEWPFGPILAAARAR